MGITFVVVAAGVVVSTDYEVGGPGDMVSARSVLSRDGAQGDEVSMQNSQHGGIWASKVGVGRGYRGGYRSYAVQVRCILTLFVCVAILLL